MDSGQPFNILLVEDNLAVAGLLSQALHNELGTTVFEAHDTDSGIQFLSTVTDIQLLLVGSCKNAEKLVRLLHSRLSPVAADLILCGKDPVSDPSLLLQGNIIGILPRKNLVQEVTQLVRTTYFPGEVVQAKESSDFIAIKLSTLLQLAPLPMDIYIRLSQTKFLKIFHQGDVFGQDDYEKYVYRRNVTQFYLRRENASVFTQALTRRIDRLLHQEHVSAIALRSVSHEIQATIRDMIQNGEVSEEVSTLVQSNLNIVLKTVGDAPGLDAITERLGKETNEYIVQHSIALSEISCVLAARLHWTAELTFRKLILASFFHDITLRSHELAKCATIEEAKRRPELLLLDSLEDFVQHPVRASDLVNGLEDVPADVHHIIIQHHELDGKGLLGGKSAFHLSPLACLWVIAHDYVDFMLLRSPEDKSLPAFLATTKNKYSSGHFKKIVRALEDGSPVT